jgi:hypothetical protein
MLENLAAGGGTWTEHQITADQVLPKVELIEDGSPALGRLAGDLIAGAVAAGLLRGSPAAIRPRPDIDPAVTRQ